MAEWRISMILTASTFSCVSSTRLYNGCVEWSRAPNGSTSYLSGVVVELELCVEQYCARQPWLKDALIWRSCVNSDNI